MIKSFYIAFENSEEWEHSEDWGVFCSRYRFPEATIKETKVNVAGSNGVIDLSSELTGDVVFNNIKGEINFIILRDSDFDYVAFKNKYHGKRVKIMPNNDTEHYRIGRLAIKEDNGQDELKIVSMILDADPFRYSVTERVYNMPINTNASQMPEVKNDSTQSNITETENGYAINMNGGKVIDSVTIGGTKYTRICAKARAELSFNTVAGRKYFIHFSFSSKYSKPKEYKDMINVGLSLFPDYTVFRSYIEITNSQKQVIGDNNFGFADKANEQKDISSFVTADGDKINLFFNAYVGCVGRNLDIDTNDKAFVISNLAFIEISEDVVLENYGRKSIVPSLIATQDCELIINEKFTQLTANIERKNFDLIVGGDTINNMIVYGTEEGTATIKYREAYL